jgi:hypothetical protein
MKFFIMVLCLFSLNAFASGKLSYKQVYDFKHERYLPMVGLSIYQPIKFGIAYNSWTGMGKDIGHNDVEQTWVVTKQGLDYNLSRLTLSLGGQFERGSVDKKIEKTAYAAVSLKLWD